MKNSTINTAVVAILMLTIGLAGYNVEISTLHIIICQSLVASFYYTVQTLVLEVFTNNPPVLSQQLQKIEDWANYYYANSEYPFFCYVTYEDGILWLTMCDSYTGASNINQEYYCYKCIKIEEKDNTFKPIENVIL